MGKRKLTAPFGWVGGKSKLAKEIIELFPEHRIYIEVFGGALNVLYRKDRSKLEVVNDINSEIDIKNIDFKAKSPASILRVAD